MNGHYIDCDNDQAYGFFMELFDTHCFRFAELVDRRLASTSALLAKLLEY